MAKKKRKASPSSDLLITKAKQYLRTMLIEKRIVWVQWRRTAGANPPSLSLDGNLVAPPEWQPSQATLELMATARRLACLEHCLDVEILWMNSAWAMYEALRAPEPHDAPTWIFDGHYWIVFETPKQTPMGEMAALLLIDRDDIGLMVESQPYQQPHRAWNSGQKKAEKQRLEALRKQEPETGRAHCEINVLDSSGAIIWSVEMNLFEDLGLLPWGFAPGYRCPTGECEELAQEASADFVPACTACQRQFEFLREWLGIALSMLRGEFRETEQLDDELESVVVHEEIEEVDPSRPSMTRLERRPHRMYLMRFDAAMKRMPAASKHPRGSWMQGRPVVEDVYEADENAVIFVQMEFREHTRTFRHERYKAVRDTTRAFPAHIHPQSMTVKEYRARRDLGEISPEGIFRAKQRRPRKRGLRVVASVYENPPEQSAQRSAELPLDP